MHPYHFHHGMRWSRGPSRLLWFLIGAGSASWWILRKDGDRRIFGHCRRVPPPPAVEAPPAPWPPQTLADIPRVIANMPPSDYSGIGIGAGAGAGAGAGDQAYQQQPLSAGARGMMGDAWDPRRTRFDDQWDMEKEQLAKISRQAADTMAEITEATLVSVLSTAEALKQKLAEHRAQREQQERIERELEEQRRNPPRLV